MRRAALLAHTTAEQHDGKDLPSRLAVTLLVAVVGGVERETRLELGTLTLARSGQPTLDLRRTRDRQVDYLGRLLRGWRHRGPVPDRTVISLAGDLTPPSRRLGSQAVRLFGGEAGERLGKPRLVCVEVPADHADARFCSIVRRLVEAMTDVSWKEPTAPNHSANGADFRLIVVGVLSASLSIVLLIVRALGAISLPVAIPLVALPAAVGDTQGLNGRFLLHRTEIGGAPSLATFARDAGLVLPTASQSLLIASIVSRDVSAVRGHDQ